MRVGYTSWYHGKASSLKWKSKNYIPSFYWYRLWNICANFFKSKPCYMIHFDTLTCVHVCTNSHTQIHILNTHTHTQKQSKAYGSRYTAIITQWTSTGMPGTTQTLNPGAANPPVAGLVTHRRAVPVSWIEIAEPEVSQWPHTANRDKDSWVFASPVTPGTQLGGLLPQLTPGHEVPIQQMGRLEQCE